IDSLRGAKGYYILLPDEREDALAEERELPESIARRHEEHPLDPGRAISPQGFRALLGGPDQQAAAQVLRRPVQHWAQDLVEHPLGRSRFFGDVERHRRQGVGEPVRVLSSAPQVLTELPPRGPEFLRRGVVG